MNQYLILDFSDKWIKPSDVIKEGRFFLSDHGYEDPWYITTSKPTNLIKLYYEILNYKKEKYLYVFIYFDDSAKLKKTDMYHVMICEANYHSIEWFYDNQIALYLTNKKIISYDESEDPDIFGGIIYCFEL